MVEWILLHRHHLSDLLHYLDDFITVGPPNSAQCALNLQTALSVCQKLGLPLHPGKCVGPSTWLVVLGIELDSVEQYARLPEEKSVVFPGSVGVPYWPFASRCKSGLAWVHLSSMDDRPSDLFSMPGPSHSFEL